MGEHIQVGPQEKPASDNLLVFNLGQWAMDNGQHPKVQ